MAATINGGKYTWTTDTVTFSTSTSSKFTMYVDDVTSNPSSEGESVPSYRTQKATGVFHLSRLADALGVPNTNAIITDPARYLEDKTYSQEVHEQLARPPQIMLRPCPVKARHGFIDSVPIRSGWVAERVRTYQGMVERIMEMEPDGEIIIAHLIDAEASAVITPTSTVVGLGHDGATSGTNAVTLPVGIDARSYAGYKISDVLEGIEPGQDVYLELVQPSTQSLPTVVQVRGGPKVKALSDYIPHDMTITAVHTITTEPDLVEWESQAAEFAPGTVVYHPGGALTSHVGIHCVLNEVPYITTFEPEVGGTLHAAEQTGWESEDYQRTAELVSRWNATDMLLSHTSKPSGTELDVVVAVLHSLGSFMQRRTNGLPELVSWSLVAAARYFSAFIIGESRHSKKVDKSKDLYKVATGFGVPDGNMEGRHDVYYQILRHDVNTLAEQVAEARVLFGYPGWAGSVGGAKWETIAYQTALFLGRLSDFQAQPNHTTMRAVLDKFNHVVNLAHNNGFWLNKLMDTHKADVLSKRPALGLVRPEVVGIVRDTDALASVDQLPITQFTPTHLMDSKAKEASDLLANYGMMMAKKLAEKITASESWPSAKSASIAMIVAEGSTTATIAAGDSASHSVTLTGQELYLSKWITNSGVFGKDPTSDTYPVWITEEGDDLVLSSPHVGPDADEHAHSEGEYQFVQVAIPANAVTTMRKWVSDYDHLTDSNGMGFYRHMLRHYHPKQFAELPTPVGPLTPLTDDEWQALLDAEAVMQYSIGPKLNAGGVLKTAAESSKHWYPYDSDLPALEHLFNHGLMGTNKPSGRATLYYITQGKSVLAVSPNVGNAPNNPLVRGSLLAFKFTGGELARAWDNYAPHPDTVGEFQSLVEEQA